MSKKTLTLIGFATLIAAAAAFLQAATPQDPGEGKFHLVYLVSTDKVEVGAKAYVEPLFFTDGKRLVFAYDYCRQYYQRLHNKPETAFPGIRIRKEDLIYPKQIATNLKTFHSYCNNKDLSIDFSKYVVRDNTGLRLSLERVEFAHETRFEDPTVGFVMPMFPERGTGTIRTVTGAPAFTPETRIEGVQQYFFIASESTSILDRIAPVVKVKSEELRALKAQLRNYAQHRITAPKNNEKFKECGLGYPFDRKGFLQGQGPTRLDRVQLLATAIADLDRDGQPDAIVSLQEDAFFERPEGAIRGSTTEIRLIYGNGHSHCYAWSPGVPKSA